MFMYILLPLEMSVCTSGRFLNFPRWGAAGPEGQIYFCCKTGGVLSGKQLPRSTHCPPSLQSEWMQRQDLLLTPVWVPLAFTSPRRGSWHTAVTKPAPAFRTRLAAIQIERFIWGIPVTAAESLSRLGASWEHWEEPFPSAAPARGEGRECGTGAHPASCPVCPLVLPCRAAWGKEEPGEETFPSCIRKCKQGCIYQQCCFQKTKLCYFSRRGVLEDQLCCWWGLPCFCWARLLLPDSIWRAGWFSGVERERQMQIHTPQQISTNRPPSSKWEMRTVWGEWHCLLTQMLLKTPSSSIPWYCRKLPSLLFINIFPPEPAICWSQAFVWGARCPHRWPKPSLLGSGTWGPWTRASSSLMDEADFCWTLQHM